MTQPPFFPDGQKAGQMNKAGAGGVVIGEVESKNTPLWASIKKNRKWKFCVRLRTSCAVMNVVSVCSA